MVVVSVLGSRVSTALVDIFDVTLGTIGASLEGFQGG